MKRIFYILSLMIFLFIVSCRDVDRISYNLSYKADKFKIKRRIVFYNGITDKYILEIIGYCSIIKDNSDNQLEVICKVGENKYKKHYFGLSDNTCYFVEQIDAKTANKYYYKVNFKPQAILPDINIRVTREMPKVNVEE